MTRSIRRGSKPTAKPVGGSVAYTKQKVPVRHIVTSFATARPIFRRGVAPTLALVREQWTIAVRRSPDRFSNLEAHYVSMGIAAAERIRDRGAQQLGGIVDKFTAVQAELSGLRLESEHLEKHTVVGPDGDLLTAEEAKARMVATANVVATQAKNGSLKHRRVTAWLRRLMPFLTALDLPVILYFIAMTLNVDLTGIFSGDQAALGQSIVPLLTSVAFGLLGTAVVAISLHFFANDVRGYKDHRGELGLPTGRAGIIPLSFLVLSILVAVCAGALMAFRIIHDSINAGGDGVGAAILGLFFSVIVVVLNVVVFSVAYRDGSLQTDEIDHLTRQLAKVAARRQQIQRQIDRLLPKLDVLRQKGEDIYNATLAKMSGPIKGANQLMLLARSYHQGCGWSTDLLAPHGNPPHSLILPIVTVDSSPLDRLLKQLHVYTTNTSERKELI